MNLSKVSFDRTRSFSSLFLNYINRDKTLDSFYGRYPEIENFKAQIEEKQEAFSADSRNILVDTLIRQYDALVNDNVGNNIELLRETNTFTVTTGHQLNIFTGPLYFIYKIVTVINTCKKLKKQYPAYNFVPVYWMASEDHDYDEIKSFRLHGHKYTWSTTQTGAVGRFTTEGFKELLAQLPGDVSIFKKAYLEQTTLANAARSYVHSLFGDEGVVVVDADDRNLKTLFSEVMLADLFDGSPKTCVDRTNKKIEDIGYATQVYCRDINLFYLDKSLRVRIERSGTSFKVVDSDLSFSEEEVKSIVENSPERLSPNVILRPLYQETILPNLAYVGGPAEVVYWLQLKELFDKFETPFPILLPRNFALVVDPSIKRKFDKTKMNWDDLFLDKHELFTQWVVRNTANNIEVNGEQTKIQELFDTLRQRANAVDTTLDQHVAAQAHRTLKSLETIEKKMLRAEKRLHREKLGQLEAVKDALFPSGGLQERVDNFLNFYQTDPDFIKRLIELFDPFDFRFNVLTYDDVSA